MGTLGIRVFGTMTLEREGVPLGSFPSRRVRDLLGFLIMNRDAVHSRERLAGTLWGDLDDRNARHCLNTALWRLQKLLAHPDSRKSDHLIVGAQTLGFNERSDVWIDLIDFDRCCQWAERLGDNDADQRAQLNARAVALYTGPILPDCYDDWCMIERERSHSLYLRALASLMSYHRDRSELGRAADFAKRILSEDPLREEVHRDLIDILIHDSRPAEALRQYHECEDVLQRELGIAPMEETQDRLRQLLAMSSMSRRGTSLDVAIAQSSSRHHSTVIGEAFSEVNRRALEFDEAYASLKLAVSNLENLLEGTQTPRTVPEDDEMCDALPETYLAAESANDPSCSSRI